ncbi:type 2 lanthipeptide synthetase LanM family protein [Blautia hominis]|uniref:Type 2 lanthipeptide synthetase LanM family protein n=1 Tax=Blautia hominis TaxID=2025493 RepID=A0ABQ0BFU5_9FIRM
MLNKNKTKVNEFVLGNGDLHEYATTVMFLYFENGERIVFKPKSSALKIFFNNLLNLIYKDLNLNAMTYKIMDKGTYCWEEYIKPKGCRTLHEFYMFYYKLGIIICVSRVLDIGDLHYENVIACGEDPMFIDVEVSLYDINVRDSVIKNSVLKTGILPVGYTDFSALSGRENQLTNFKIPKVINRKSSDIKIIYQNSYTKEFSNRPFLINDCLNNNHDILVTKIKKGFEKAYIFCFKNKDKIKKLIPLNIRSRVLFNNTQEYSMLINVLYSAELMKNENVRYKYLHDYFSSKTYKSNLLKDLEEETVLNGYIPTYYCDWSNTILITNNQYIDNFFDDKKYNHILYNFDCLNYYDLNIQIRIITLLLYKPSNIKNINPIVNFNSEKTINICSSSLCNAINKISDELISGLIDCDNRIGWVTLAPNSEYVHYKIIITDMYLYNGISGIAIFFAALIKYNCQQKYIDIFHTLINEMFKYTDDLLKKKTINGSIGIMAGEGSIAYSYQILYVLTMDVIYLEYAKKHLYILKKCSSNKSSSSNIESKCDLLYGAVGGILVYINMYKLSKNIIYLEEAINLLEVNNILKIHNNIEEWGIAHGKFGYLLILIELFKLTHDEKYSKTIKSIMSEYMRIYQFNQTALGKANNMSWCNGISGILLVLHKMNSVPELRNESIITHINTLFYRYKQEYQLNEECLCHGNTGLYSILQVCNHQKDFLCARIKYCEQLSKEIMNKDIKNELSIPGFMLGISGIGYFLISQVSDIPPIIDLDINF